MNDEPPQSGAALAGGSDGGKHDGAEGEIEIGGWVTIMPLLPPSSNRLRPRRCARQTPTARPMATEPVAETSGKRGDRGNLLAYIGAAMK